MDLAILNEYALGFLLRVFHILGGVTWIGLLYYFNFVQMDYFKTASAESKSDAVQHLVPRALWWFRWGAMLTFLTGVGLLGFYRLEGIGIITGAVLGTLMFLNVWLVIWPNQKVVIASAKSVAEGGDADPNAATALAKAGLASRTNTLFSIPMLFFMAVSRHLFGAVDISIVRAPNLLELVLVFGLILILELNALFGKMGPLKSVAGVVHMGLLLTVVLYLMIEFL